MRTYVVAFVLAAVVAVILTPIVRRFAPKVGAVDLPSGRRVNKRVIPRLGGIAILAGFLAPLVGLFFYSNDISDLFLEDLYRAIALIIGAVAMAALGALDDIKGARALLKLAVQILVAIGAFTGGFRIETISLPFIGSLDMGIFAAPVTVFWIVGIVNAVNLMDGLDGLAAGVSFFVCVVNFVIGIISGNILVCLFAVSLAGALIGFLFFNFNPATIFMGDTGSMTIGYILATSSLLGSKGGTAVALLVPVLAMGVPILDTLLAIVRRFLARRPIFSPDKGHLHHKLMDMGVTHRRAVLTIYGISILFTSVAILIYLGRSDWQVGLALLVATALVFVMMRVVGVFQLRQIRKQQLRHVYDPVTDRIKRSLPDFIVATSNCNGEDDLKQALSDFGSSAKLVFIGCFGEGDWPLCGWSWDSSNSNGNTKSLRGYVSARFSVPGKEGDESVVEFGWYSDTADVYPQTDILLRVVVDSILYTNLDE